MINDMYRAQRIAGSGLKASRNWINTISNNIANVNSLDTGTKAADGNFVPYARQVPVFEKVLTENFRRNKVNDDVMNGVAVKEIAELKDKVKKVYDPSHPAARKEGSMDAGYVYYPEISVAQEMADLRVAAATYEANLTVVSVSGRMTSQALSLTRRS
jgi:flagellar basal-body rod protein FlgC